MKFETKFEYEIVVIFIKLISSYFIFVLIVLYVIHWRWIKVNVGAYNLQMF